MSSDTPSKPVEKRVWNTPQIESIGEMSDVMSGGAQPPADSSQPGVAAAS